MLLQQQQRRRRPAEQRHYFDWRTPWIHIFADEMLTRARMLGAFATADRHHDDFLDQVEEAERLFAGLPWGDDDCVSDDDGPPYVGDIEM